MPSAVASPVAADRDGRVFFSGFCGRYGGDGAAATTRNLPYIPGSTFDELDTVLFVVVAGFFSLPSDMMKYEWELLILICLMSTFEMTPFEFSNIS